MNIKKEWLWLLGTLILTLGLFLLFASEALSGKPIDLPLYDTYFVFHPLSMVLNLWLTIALVVFMVRCFWYKLGNLPTNIASIILLGLALVQLTKLIVFIANLYNGWVVYPPNIDEIPAAPTISLGGFYFFQYILISLIAVLGIMSGKQICVSKGDGVV